VNGADVVECANCSHPYTDHDPDAGHCGHLIGAELVDPAHALPCPCSRFRWVDPDARVPRYGEPPQLP
jgi:hypothetical protein